MRKRENVYFLKHMAYFDQKGTDGKDFDLLTCFSYISHSGMVCVEC